MKYLVMAFDANGRRLFTESAEYDHGVLEITDYARDLGAAKVYVYGLVDERDLS